MNEDGISYEVVEEIYEMRRREGIVPHSFPNLIGVIVKMSDESGHTGFAVIGDHKVSGATLGEIKAKILEEKCNVEFRKHNCAVQEK